MFILRKIDNSEESYKLLYSFTISNNPNWKKTYIVGFTMQGKIPAKQGNLSDYEYFKILKNEQNQISFLESEEYLLIKNGEPVTSVYVMMQNKNVANISFTTIKKHQKQGYATQALYLIEQILFNNPEILFTTITDMSKAKVSSKIAKKAGYECIDGNTFIKINPNKNLDELIKGKEKKYKR